MEDIRVKICGKSKWIDYSKNPTFLDYIRVYAPEDDGNSPSGYCQAMIRELRTKGYQLSQDTPLYTMCRMIQNIQDSTGIPNDPRAISRAMQRLQKLIMNAIDPRISQVYQKQLERLKRRLSSIFPTSNA